MTEGIRKPNDKDFGITPTDAKKKKPDEQKTEERALKEIRQELSKTSSIEKTLIPIKEYDDTTQVGHQFIKEPLSGKQLATTLLESLRAKQEIKKSNEVIVISVSDSNKLLVEIVPIKTIDTDFLTTQSVHESRLKLLLQNVNSNLRKDLNNVLAQEAQPILKAALEQMHNCYQTVQSNPANVEKRKELGTLLAYFTEETRRPSLREYIRNQPEIIYENDFPKELLNDFELIYIALAKMPSACLVMGENLKEYKELSQKIIIEAILSLNIGDTENQIIKNKNEIEQLAQKLLPPTKAKVNHLFQKFCESFDETRDISDNISDVYHFVQNYPLPSYQQLINCINDLKITHFIDILPDKDKYPIFHESFIWLATPSGLKLFSSYSSLEPLKQVMKIGVMASISDKGFILNKEVIRTAIAILPHYIIYCNPLIEKDPEFHDLYLTQLKQRISLYPKWLPQKWVPEAVKNDIDVITQCLAKDFTLYSKISPKLISTYPEKITDALTHGIDRYLDQELDLHETQILFTSTFELLIGINEITTPLPELKIEELRDHGIQDRALLDKLVQKKTTINRSFKKILTAIKDHYELEPTDTKKRALEAMVTTFAQQLYVPEKEFKIYISELAKKPGWTQFISDLSEFIPLFSTNG